MWQFFIVPCREEREKEGISLASVVEYFHIVKKDNPEIKLLFSDCSKKISGGNEELKW
ncbi:hypothetical protein [Enterococcus sp. DIV1420a]|uniref:hypothetical protein n=1 Tax=Enterococcus sp. DIV1420a TaxID=2774672 RepID=UPI003F279185